MVCSCACRRRSFRKARKCDSRMIEILLNEVSIMLNDYCRLKNLPLLFKCSLGDISIHDKNNETGGDEENQESIILSLVSIEEENAMKNNYPLRHVGPVYVQEKSAVYVNLFLLFSAKYATYSTALKAISLVVGAFQAARKVVFTVDSQKQEVVLYLHNLGFENLNNLWTVLGGRYLPSVIYRARLLMYQESPPVDGALITDIREESL